MQRRLTAIHALKRSNHPSSYITRRSASAACGRARVELQRRHREHEAARAEHSRLSGKSGPSAAQFAERVARARARRDGGARHERPPASHTIRIYFKVPLVTYSGLTRQVRARAGEGGGGVHRGTGSQSRVHVAGERMCVHVSPVHVSQTRLLVRVYVADLHAARAGGVREAQDRGDTWTWS